MVKFYYYTSIFCVFATALCGWFGIAIGFVFLSALFVYLEEKERETTRIPVSSEIYEILKILAEKEGLDVNQYAEKILKEEREEHGRKATSE